ncbi:MAG TPA: hypothetical protein P5317_07670 [Myxococcota bacterium]|nr:hypothetical protein [Myxococcota bacterium]HRV17874.1 hypothetical protein [Myxococcota bacterium]
MARKKAKAVVQAESGERAETPLEVTQIESAPAQDTEKVWPDLVIMRYIGNGAAATRFGGNPSGAKYLLIDGHIRAYGQDVDHLLASGNFEV